MTRITHDNPRGDYNPQGPHRKRAGRSQAEGAYRRAMQLGKECAARYRRALAKLAR